MTSKKVRLWDWDLWTVGRLRPLLLLLGAPPPHLQHGDTERGVWRKLQPSMLMKAALGSWAAAAQVPQQSHQKGSYFCCSCVWLVHGLLLEALFITRSFFLCDLHPGPRSHEKKMNRVLLPSLKLSWFLNVQSALLHPGSPGWDNNWGGFFFLKSP